MNDMSGMCFDYFMVLLRCLLLVPVATQRFRSIEASTANSCQFSATSLDRKKKKKKEK